MYTPHRISASGSPDPGFPGNPGKFRPRRAGGPGGLPTENLKGVRLAPQLHEGSGSNFPKTCPPKPLKDQNGARLLVTAPGT